jgi:hypothetical protein
VFLSRYGAAGNEAGAVPGPGSEMNECGERTALCSHVSQLAAGDDGVPPPAHPCASESAIGESRDLFCSALLEYPKGPLLPFVACRPSSPTHHTPQRLPPRQSFQRCPSPLRTPVCVLDGLDGPPLSSHAPPVVVRTHRTPGLN